MTSKLNYRERATIAVLFFIVKLLNPTGYQHEVNKLEETLKGDIDYESNKTS